MAFWGFFFFCADFGAGGFVGPVGAGARMDGGPWFRMDGGCAFCEGAKMLGGPASAPPKAPGVNRDAIAPRLG